MGQGKDDTIGDCVAEMNDADLKQGTMLDIYPGAVEEVAIVNRMDLEADCWGWSNESYANNWRTPQWRLPHGRYLVSVTVRRWTPFCKIEIVLPTAVTLSSVPAVSTPLL